MVRIIALCDRGSQGLVFFFNDTATTEIYTLSLHDALPIAVGGEPELEVVTGHRPAPFQARAAASPPGGAGRDAGATGWCRGARPSRWPPRRRSARRCPPG